MTEFLVSGGPDPEPRPVRERGDRWLLQLIALGVVATAVGSGVTAWTSYRAEEVNREVQCIYADAGFSTDEDDPDSIQNRLVDALGCDTDR